MLCTSDSSDGCQIYGSGITPRVSMIDPKITHLISDLKQTEQQACQRDEILHGSLDAKQEEFRKSFPRVSRVDEIRTAFLSSHQISVLPVLFGMIPRKQVHRSHCQEGKHSKCSYYTLFPVNMVLLCSKTNRFGQQLN